MVRINQGIKNPTGSLLSDVVVTITCIESTEVVKGAKSVERSKEDNTFDFTLSLGTYQITVGRINKSVFYDRSVRITSSTPTTLSITDLLNNYVCDTEK